MAAGTFVGRLVFIGKPVNVGKKKPFYKRTIAVDDSSDDRYPNPVPFELSRDNLNLADGFSVGDEVKVQYYLNGRAWDDPKSGETRYFTSLNCVALTHASENGGLTATDAGTDGDADATGSEGGADEEFPF